MIPHLLILLATATPCTEVDKIPPNKPEHQLLRGHCAIDPIEATTHYQKAGTPEAFAALGERHYLMGNYVLALDYFQKTLKTTSLDPVVNSSLTYWMALSLFSSGKHDEAEKVLKKMNQSKLPVCEIGFDCLVDGSPKSRAPVVMALVRVLEYRHRWTEASKILENYFKQQDAPSVRWVLDLRLQLGSFYFRLQKPKEAYMEFARILRFFPESAQAFWLRDHYSTNEILKRYGSKVSSLR